jgi:hypothetical protein
LKSGPAKNQKDTDKTGIIVENRGKGWYLVKIQGTNKSIKWRGKEIMVVLDL